MLRNDLITVVKDKLDGKYPKTAIVEIESVIEETIIETVGSSEEVNLVGFLKILAKDIEAREYRNPKTGEKVPSPAHKVVKVKIGKALKDCMES